MLKPKLRKKTLIIEMLMQNFTNGEIAEKVGCQRAYVTQISKEVGIRAVRKRKSGEIIPPRTYRDRITLRCDFCTRELHTFKRTQDAAWDVAIDNGWSWSNEYSYSAGESDLILRCPSCQ